MGSWIRAGHQKLGVFSPTPHSPERGEGLEMELVGGSGLCHEASIKAPKVGGSERFWVDEHMEVLGG